MAPDFETLLYKAHAAVATRNGVMNALSTDTFFARRKPGENDAPRAHRNPE